MQSLVSLPRMLHNLECSQALRQSSVPQNDTKEVGATVLITLQTLPVIEELSFMENFMQDTSLNNICTVALSNAYGRAL